MLKKQVGYFLSLVLVASFFFNIQASYAIYDGARSTGYSESDHMCSTGGIDFDPLASNNDVNWELTNPICLTFISIQGAAIVAAGIVTDVLCKPLNIFGQTTAQAEAIKAAVVETPFLSPLTALKMAGRGFSCAARSAELGIATGLMTACMSATLGVGAAACAPQSVQVGFAGADQSRCCLALSSYLAAVAIGIATLGIIYAVAKGAYEKARVCGHDWNSWKMVDENGDYNSDLAKIRWRSGKYPGSRQYCIEDIFIGHDNPLDSADVIYNSCGYSPDGTPSANDISVKNKHFREYLYGGKEIEDSNGCKNPASWDGAHRLRSLGYTNDNQRYYMTGPGGASNYACHRFILEDANDPSAMAAYECCKNRSQNTICIENAPLTDDSYDRNFCELGSRCDVKGIIFEPYSSKISPNFICAKTYSVCPYNHLLGGGTEVGEYALDAEGSPTSDITNFCQYRKHCVKVPVLPYIRISSLEGAYISAACRNLKGDSQNEYSYNADLLPISTRGFSAPLVQCFKESIENALLNKAGDTKCKDPDERASNGVCVSGYFYKKDQPLETPSFFGKFQDAVRAAIKIVLTISISLLGAMVLIGISPLSKKQLLMYILKIALVMYFALGTGWQFGFIDGILGSSNYLSDIMMRLDYAEGDDPAKKDGCQFPRFNYADDNYETKYAAPAYPPGKEYLKIWDVLDCKLARALGFGPELSVPNLVKMIFAGFLTGGLGLIFLVATFIFAFFMLSVIMRAIHIFLMASVAIVLLIYVSPITITLALFERTKGIFDGWWKQILGLALQPVILFAYLGVYISLFDSLVIGKATFRGDGHTAPKTVVCNAEAANTSLYCIFRVADLKTYSGLEAIGIGLPMLTSMNKEKLDSIIKAAFIMFIFAGFMDKISTLAAELVGGSELKSNSMSAMDMAKKSFGALNAVQERGMRAIMKHGGSAAKAVGKRASMSMLAEGLKRGGYGGKPSVMKKEGDSSAASGAAKAGGADSSAARGGGADSSSKKADGSSASVGGTKKDLDGESDV